MQDENLTIEECNEFADALFEDAGALAEGSKKESLLKLAKSYRHLAKLKKIVSRMVS